MSGKILQHIIFWLLFTTLYSLVKLLFAGPSDMIYPPFHRFLRFLFMELAFLPWKIIPFYFLFYFLIPRYFQRGNYLKISLLFLASLVICLFGYRSMVSPVSGIMYDEKPAFNVYSFSRLMYSLTDIIPAIGLASSIKLLRGRTESQRKMQELRQEKQRSELSFLKAQTNPHFLFNTLNNLYGLARKNDEHTAASILKLAHIMRYILHECSAPRIPIRKEVKVLEDYIDLERLRYNERLRVHFEQDIDNPERAIAPLILLPFVENAFKHGAGENRFETLIQIQLHLCGPHLFFRIANTIDVEAPQPAKGIGLPNIKRQLDLIYGKNQQLEIQSEQEEFTVHLSIQLEEHDHNEKTALSDH